MIRHFSHQHPLSPIKLDQIQNTNDNNDHNNDHDHDHDDDDHSDVCSGCELELTPGTTAYACEKPGCGFRIHEECSELPREIRHVSHPRHALCLVFEPPRSFSCAACVGSSGTAFVYACRVCGFGLHVRCSALPEAVHRPDRHPHPLALVPAVPGPPRDCGACGCGFVEGCWAYFCSGCDFAAHLECIVVEDEDEEEEEEEEEEEDEERSTMHVIVESQKTEIAV